MDKQQRLQEWLARITDFKSSGLTMSAWCQAHGQTIHQLKYWLRKLNEPSSSTSSSSSGYSFPPNCSKNNKFERSPA